MSRLQTACGQPDLQIWCPCYNYGHNICSKPILRSDYSFQPLSYISPDFSDKSKENAELATGCDLQRSKGKMTQVSLEVTPPMEKVLRMIKYGLKNSFQRFKSSNVRFSHWTTCHRFRLGYPPFCLPFSHLPSPFSYNSVPCVSTNHNTQSSMSPRSQFFDPSSEIICPQMLFNFPPTISYKLCFFPASICTLSRGGVPGNGITGWVIRAGHFSLPLL